jgi:hypothetical protein
MAEVFIFFLTHDKMHGSRFDPIVDSSIEQALSCSQNSARPNHDPRAQLWPSASDHIDTAYCKPRPFVRGHSHPLVFFAENSGGYIRVRTLPESWFAQCTNDREQWKEDIY